KSDAALRGQLEQLSSEVLYQRLQQRDPDRARSLHPNDRVRVIRALEIQESDDGDVSSLYAHHRSQPQRFEASVIVLLRSRQELYSRIRERAVKMIEGGLIEEVRALTDYYVESGVLQQAIGYSD